MKWTLPSVLVLAIGCGGSAPPSKPVTVGPGAPTEGGQDALGAADLSPVAAPAELFVVGRLQNPGKTIDTIAAWSKAPIDWRQMLAKQEPGLERVVQLDAPIEFAVALDPNAKGQMPEPLAVFSIGLTSLQAAVELAREKGENVRQVRGGVFRMGDDGECALAASVGKAPARLVCGERAEDVDALLPYATRGLPSEQLGSADFHVQLRAEPVRRRHGRDLRQLKLLAPFAVRDLSIDNARFDRALKDAAHGLAEEIINLAEDLDTISVDGWLRADAVEATASIKLKSSQSWTAQTFADLGKRAGAPTEAFWKLPGDADSASFAAGMDPKRYESIRRTLAELLDGWLEHEKVPRRVRDDLVDLVEEAFKTDGASAYAAGSLPSSGAPKTDAEISRELMRQTIGWHIVYINDKPERYKKYLGSAARSYNDAQLRKTLQQKLHVEPKDLPKLTTRGGRGLPAGSTVYELSVPAHVFEMGNMPAPAGAPGKKPAPGKPMSFVLVVVPQGTSTWLGFSVDEKVLTEKLNASIKGGADKSLASREGLTSLKNASAVSGGFFSLASFMGSVQGWMWRAQSDGSERLLASMPHKGTTPMPQLLRIQTQGKGLVADWQLRVPRAVVEDIGAAVPAMAGGMTTIGGPAGVRPAQPPPPAPAPRRP